MRFLDRVKVYIQSGDGGDGCRSFVRERSNPFGGPDGGQGGDGGDVIVKAIDGLNTLIDFSYQQHFKAGSGKNGQSKRRHGARGKDVVLYVPQGTQVFDDESACLLADLEKAGQQYVLLQGGHGGKGNTTSKATKQHGPQDDTYGEKGQEQRVVFCLKLLADVGLVGLPNAGKSSFLAACTRAKPQIADYAFTTLIPKLGVVEYKYGQQFTLADIPGICVGTSSGRHLGVRFLQHLERTRILVHIIDIQQRNPLKAYHKVRKELRLHNDTLAKKTEIVVLNKCDTLTSHIIAKKHTSLQQNLGVTVYPLATHHPPSLTQVVQHIHNTLSL